MLPELGLDALLVAGAIGLGAPYTARFSTRRRKAETEPVPEAPSWTPIRVWQEMIGCPGGALPGSRLVGLERVRNGSAATIQLVGGKQHTGTATAQKQLIASAYAQAMQVTADCIEVEAPLSNRPDQARLLILDDNPLHQVQAWQGPTLGLHTAGSAVCARFGDSALARMQWFELGSGALNWIVAGVPGSGKTSFVNWLLAESAHATYRDLTGRVRPLVGTVYVDGKRGQSIPEATESPGIGWAGTWPEEGARAILAFRQAMYARQRFLGRLAWVDPRGRPRRGMAYFDPIVSGLPYLQLVIEEWPKFVTDYPGWLVDVVHEIAKIGRSLGMRVVIVAQSITGDELGSTELRNVMGGGAVVFRTNDRTTSGMAFAGQLEVDPSSLPMDMLGSCFVKGPDARAAMARGLLVEDPFGWLSTAPAWEFGAVDVEAMGEGLALARARREFYEEHGQDPDALPALWAPILAQHRGVSAAEVSAQLLGQVPAVEPVARAEPEPEGTLDDLVVAAVCSAAGELMDRAEVIAYVLAHADREWSPRSIGSALTRCAEQRRIDKPMHGRYRTAHELITKGSAA